MQVLGTSDVEETPPTPDVCSLDLNALVEYRRHLAKQVVGLCFPKYPEEDIESMCQGQSHVLEHCAVDPYKLRIFFYSRHV
jgi:hypothetical protein